VVVNEIMPVPPTAEPEWIELFNFSDTTVDLTNWWIADLQTAVSLPPLVIPPQGYAILTRDTAALREARYIPENAFLVELKLPTLNNTSDAILLRRSDSVLVDSLFYSMRWGKKAISLERRQATLPAWSADNLVPCQAPAGATPGEVNSITPVPNDYCLLELAMFSPLAFRLVVLNNGTAPQTSAVAILWVDVDRDHHFSPTEIRHRLDIPALAPMQRWEATVAAEILWGDIPAGWYEVRAAISLTGDVRWWNDTVYRRFYRSATLPNIRVNEILYNPPAEGAEFVELINVGDDTLVLEGWKLHDWRPTGADTLVIRTALRVPPGGFVVIAWDSAVMRPYPWLSAHRGVYIGSSSLILNNDADAVVVRDPNDVVVDSVYYFASWHDPALRGTRRGISLEKLHPLLPSTDASSWSSCGAPEGATPGKTNSIAVPLPLRGSLTASPNPFRLSEAERRYCVIAYEIPFPKALVTVRIFNEEGILLRTVTQARFSAAQSHVVWDGRTDRGELLPPGLYVIALEAVDTETSRTYGAKSSLVVTY